MFRETGEDLPDPRRLRILTFLHSFERGGVERVGLRLAGAWRDSGADVCVVLGRDIGAGRTDAPAFPYEFLPPARRLSDRFGTLRLMRWLPSVVRRQRPDVIFAAGNTYAGIAVALKLLLGAACPPIVLKVSNDLHRHDMGSALRWVYGKWLHLQGQYLDHFIGMAEANHQEIVDAFDVSPVRVSIVHDPALSQAQFETLSTAAKVKKAEGRVFLAAGRLVRQKNFPLLLQAFHDIAQCDDRLVILGEGPGRRRIERLAASLGIERQLLMPGHADPAQWLPIANMFVLSSDYEGLPAVVIEALAAGLPIVATRCSVAMPGLLGEGRFGALVPRRDRKALGEAMRDIDQNRCDRKALGAQAARHTIEVGGPAYLAVLNRIGTARAAATNGALRDRGTR